MPNRWVVLLEAARDPADDPIDVGDLKRLHDALEAGLDGGVLHCPDRYALQVTATGAGPFDALLDVVLRWTAAVDRLGLPAWNLVRTEVFTPADLERELQRDQGGEGTVDRPNADRGRDDHEDIGRELLRRAFADPLTGLLGREAFAHRLETVVGNRGAVAVVSLGLDGFQDVNDRFGGSAGDEVLSALARRLAPMLRPGDVLARLGGDQYGVLLNDSTEDAALAVARRLLEAVSLPMTISDQELTLVASAGVALGQSGNGAETVLANAEAALAAAKAGGGGGPVLFGSDVSHRA